MCHGRGVPLDRHLGQPRRLQSPLGADAQRVGVAAQHVARHEVPYDVVEEVLLGVDQDVLDRAERERALPEQSRGLRVEAARVDRGRDYVAPVRLLEPRHAERGIEASGKGQDDR